jgi:phosphatidylserine/phosphatidylglycerophosphate/cardiolipin synthase-like enzyme
MSALAQPSTSRARAATTAPLAKAPVAKRRARATATEAAERDQLLDRLRSLRRVLPALAQEMAAARRQAAHLRIDNRRLTNQVRELRAELQARDHKPT